MNKKIKNKKVRLINSWVRKSPKGGNWYAHVSINWKQYYLGTYLTREDTITIIREMLRRDMDMEQLPDVVNELGLNKTSTFNPKYYYPRKKGNKIYYEVKKTIKGESRCYGVYKSEEIAKAIIKELKKVNWNKKYLGEIKRKIL